MTTVPDDLGGAGHFWGHSGTKKWKKTFTNTPLPGLDGSLPPTRILPAQEIKRAARSNERPVSFAGATYFELEPVLPEPMPLEPPVLPAPDGLLLLGDALEPLE